MLNNVLPARSRSVQTCVVFMHNAPRAVQNDAGYIAVDVFYAITSVWSGTNLENVLSLTLHHNFNLKVLVNEFQKTLLA